MTKTTLEIDLITKAASRVHSTWTFGGEPFLRALWEAYYQNTTTDLDWAEFSELLLDAHQAGELELARMDLVTALDAEQRVVCEASEVRRETATFHMLVRT